MSLFNEVSESLSKQAVGDLRSRLQSKVRQGLNAATHGINGHIPTELQRYSSGLIGKVTQKVANRYGVLPKNNMRSRKTVVKGGGTPEYFWTTKNPLMGGITPREAKKLYEQAISESRSRKNLWLLEVSSNLNNGQQNIPDLFNLFATDVSYSPFILSGDSVKIGGANYDSVKGHEPSELTITTYDDENGSLKKWFGAHHNAATSRDGTVSEPGTYAITVKIIHNAITRETAEGRYESIGLFRPTSMEVQLSRSDDGLEELQMTFTQIDTFMRP